MSTDEHLARQLREALAQRDSIERAPAFARLWNRASRRPSHLFSLPRVAFAGAAAVLMAVVLVRLDGRDAGASFSGAELAMARQLSSNEYWRVPSDGILAASGVREPGVLPNVQPFAVSFEESVL